MEDRIKELGNLIKLKRTELKDLKYELACTKVDNLCKKKGMKKNQRFLYEGEKCSFLFINPDNGWFFSAKRIKKTELFLTGILLYIILIKLTLLINLINYDSRADSIN